MRERVVFKNEQMYRISKWLRSGPSGKVLTKQEVGGSGLGSSTLTASILTDRMAVWSSRVMAYH